MVASARSVDLIFKGHTGSWEKDSFMCIVHHVVPLSSIGEQYRVIGSGARTQAERPDLAAADN